MRRRHTHKTQKHRLRTGATAREVRGRSEGEGARTERAYSKEMGVENPDRTPRTVESIC